MGEGSHYELNNKDVSNLEPFTYFFSVSVLHTTIQEAGLKVYVCMWTCLNVDSNQFNVSQLSSVNGVQ